MGCLYFYLVAAGVDNYDYIFSIITWYFRLNIKILFYSLLRASDTKDGIFG